MFSPLVAPICFVVCHEEPAEHFITFTKNMLLKGNAVEIYAAEPLKKKFQDLQIPINFFPIPSSKSALPETIAKACCSASVVITDVGHEFTYRVLKALAKKLPYIPRLAYYESPKPYVPNYSTTAAKVIGAATCVLFASSHLANSTIFEEPNKAIDFGNRKKIGIGYYPTFESLRVNSNWFEILEKTIKEANAIPPRKQVIHLEKRSHRFYYLVDGCIFAYYLAGPALILVLLAIRFFKPQSS